MSITITKFHPYESGALIGFADIEVPKWGVFIKGCKVFRKNGSEWMTLPSREYEENGERKYAPLIGFGNEEWFKAFKKSMDAAWADYVAANNAPTQQAPSGGVTVGSVPSTPAGPAVPCEGVPF